MLVMGTRRTLNDLIGVTEHHVRQTLITFLSVLELAKLGFVGLYQTETYGDIWIDLIKPIENDAVSRVEEYESLDSAADSDGVNEAPADEDFVLVDAEDILAQPDDAGGVVEADMASDEEILQAEMELESQPAESAVVDADDAVSSPEPEAQV